MPVVAIDPTSSDIVVAAGLQGSVNFGGGLLTSHGGSSGYDTVLVKFDSSGAFQWSQDFGNGMEVSANSVAVDASGNIAMAGLFQGNVNFGGKRLTAVGAFDVFVVEFDSTGGYLWSESFGSAGQVTNLDTVAVDPSGNVLIAGIANGPTNFGSGSLTGYYIAKFSPSGAYQWSDAFDVSCDETSPKMAVDGSSNVFLAGCFVGSADFGGGALTTEHFSAFVAKLAPSGVYEWANQYGDPTTTGAVFSDLALDACGNVLVTGDLDGFAGTATITFGADTLTASDPSSAYDFVGKIDPTGAGVWAQLFVASGTNVAMNAGSIAVDASGGPTTTYGLSGTTDFGGGDLTSPGSTNIAVASFDASGSYRWAYVAGASSTAVMAGVTGVAANSASAIIVGSFGTCSGGGSCTTSPPGTTLVLAGHTLTAVSASDLFIASFAP